jgi:hypothetical protein
LLGLFVRSIVNPVFQNIYHFIRQNFLSVVVFPLLTDIGCQHTIEHTFFSMVGHNNFSPFLLCRRLPNDGFKALTLSQEQPRRSMVAGTVTVGAGGVEDVCLYG